MSGLVERVETVSVLRPRSCFGVQGWEIGGVLGISVLAWKDHILWAQELAGTSFDPPLPLLLGEAAGKKTWSGIVSSGGKSMVATATLDQAPSSFTLAGRKILAKKVIVTLVMPRRTVTTESVYGESFGLLSQRQQENGVVTRSLAYVAGP